MLSGGRCFGKNQLPTLATRLKISTNLQISKGVLSFIRITAISLKLWTLISLTYDIFYLFQRFFDSDLKINKATDFFQEALSKNF